MYAPRLPRIGTYVAWRDAARRLAGSDVPPDQVDWGLEGGDVPMFDAPLPEAGRPLTVPSVFADLTRSLVPERSGQGFALAYSLLVRLQTDPRLLSNRADPDVARARDIAKSVHRDLHKMHAFVRFREEESVLRENGRRAFSAWFEPDHRIEEPVADFFVNRFGDMDWRIVTPEVTIAYLDGALSLHAVPSVRPDASDPLEQLWTTYYSNIFNPARLKPDAMRAEMPKKYWRNLPEAQAIPSLIAGARARVASMQAAGPTQPSPASLRRKEPEMPRTPGPDLFGTPEPGELARQARGCTRCPLHAPATQVVWGEGPPDAGLMFVGEQPGDREDIAGRPFVGPAGQLFDEVAGQAGIDRASAYVTNAVKHFKFVQKGKRRIHQRPAAGEISACRWWLDQELSAIDPDVVVALGATALHALTGDGKGILKRRGAIEETRDGRLLFVTVHPSFLLRLPTEEARAHETELFRQDLSRVRALVEAS
ncbi:UdgX family uracil-DNA binding protein [Jannaschia sp. S6380]|uniref:UdgX family uracil-DNA binding protein n=1 Tax=Jannaschia sp. S6380 TaxID=2926408 RepID=UPI001FF26733|nr:UdgX family uracil-DNA binding protein [Jannaschia sp. S6380]MCK0168394.1 UdgX family uracil-DNA binding protein [Jannaschia sp. S6380]